MSLALTVSNIRKSYSGKPVLEDVSLSFDRNAVYVLTGPNGSGKSTFLRICGLIEDADSGEIVYTSEGGMLKHDIRLKRRITLVLPRIGLFNTTVFKNAAYGLNIRGSKGADAARRVDEVLTFVGLAHKKDQSALTISSGERQRLGIARALVIEPEILFLDEPTASIDEKNSAIVEDIILDLKAGGRTTVIMTTHDKDQAGRLADSWLTMHAGKLIPHP